MDSVVMGHLLYLVAGIELVAKVMEGWQKHEGVQCNCCLAIMALVRGTGSVCQVPALHFLHVHHVIHVHALQHAHTYIYRHRHRHRHRHVPLPAIYVNFPGA